MLASDANFIGRMRAPAALRKELMNGCGGFCFWIPKQVACKLVGTGALNASGLAAHCKRAVAACCSAFRAATRQQSRRCFSSRRAAYALSWTLHTGFDSPCHVSIEGLQIWEKAQSWAGWLEGTVASGGGARWHAPAPCIWQPNCLFPNASSW